MGEDKEPGFPRLQCRHGDDIVDRVLSLIAPFQLCRATKKLMLLDFPKLFMAYHPVLYKQLIFLTSFDHLVGAAEQRRWQGDAKRLCGLQANHEFILDWLFDRQVGWFSTLENLINEAGGPTK